MHRFGAQYMYGILWYLCCVFCSVASIELDETGRSELSRNITKILNQLVHKDKYDKRLRPNYGGPPVDVGITIYVSSISAVSEVEMDYTLDIYLRQMWTDNRLEFKGVNKTHITIDVEYMKSIWVPDTFFPNEKKSFFHTATTHNSFLRITKFGNVTTSQRLTVTASCPMELHLFPLDSQECMLEIESYGYSSLDIKYKWFKGDESVSLGDVTLPQFKTAGFRIEEKEIGLTTGRYSRLICHFYFKRSIGFYMIQIYLPSILIVVISWVSFWLNRDATPARVALGVTTVLTMTTLMTTTNASMPKVSYIKSIDIYLGTCFMMVFASLLEYAAVGYLNKRIRMKRDETRQGGHYSNKEKDDEDFCEMPLEQSETRPILENRGTVNRNADTSGLNTYGIPQPTKQPNASLSSVAHRKYKILAEDMDYPRYSGVLEGECDCYPMRGGILLQRSHSVISHRNSVRFELAKPEEYTKETVTPRKRRPWREISPSSIDKYSHGYSEDDIKYFWDPPRNVTVKLDDQVRLPQFDIKSFTVSNKTQVLTTGSYSRLSVKFLFVRNIGFYMMQIYLPSMLIVVISWVSFWIHRDASPARVALGVTTVLTMTTLMSTTNASLPKVSYIKAIDMYLGTCFVMVFASLLEYAAVSYLNKKMKMKREKKKQEQTQVQEFSIMPSTSKIGSPASCTMLFLDGYSTEDIRLNWAVGKAPPVNIVEDLKLPTFELDDIDFENKTIVLSTGSYSRLSCKFKFVRTLGFYWIQIYQPSILVVIISWVSFWINRESAPARVTLGIMTVLTMTTLMTTTNRQMPKVSYVKAVDVYLVVCYVMVFAALLEYALVSYSNKKKQDFNKRRQAPTRSSAVSPPPTTPVSFSGMAASGAQPGQMVVTKRKNASAGSDSTIMQSPFWSSHAQHQGFQITSHQPDIVDQLSKNSTLQSPTDPRMETTFSDDMPFDYPRMSFDKPRHRSSHRKRKVSVDERVKMIASKVDKYARMIFPGVFILFNLVYWLTYLKLSGKI